MAIEGGGARGANSQELLVASDARWLMAPFVVGFFDRTQGGQVAAGSRLPRCICLVVYGGKCTDEQNLKRIAPED
jgi:hypothetical protein